MIANVKVVAHLSDPHFGTVQPPVRDALLRDLREHSPAFVLMTGDITQRARSAQFQSAREFLDALAPLPWMAIPGNHDLPLFDILTRLFNPYRLYRRFIAADLNPVYRDDDIAVLCVNATRPSRHKNGVLSGKQIDQVAERLMHLSQPFKIVAVHQPLAVPVESELHNVARGADHALACWLDAGADLFVGGHIHLPYCMPATSTSSARRGVIAQAGTCLSSRVRHDVPNSYNRLIFESSDITRRMRVEQRDYDSGTDRFALKRSTTAHFSGADWTIDATPV